MVHLQLRMSQQCSKQHKVEGCVRLQKLYQEVVHVAPPPMLFLIGMPVALIHLSSHPVSLKDLSCPLVTKINYLTD